MILIGNSPRSLDCSYLQKFIKFYYFVEKHTHVFLHKIMTFTMTLYPGNPNTLIGSPLPRRDENMQALRNPSPSCTMGTSCVTLLHLSQILKSNSATPKSHALPWDWAMYILENIDTVMGLMLTHSCLCDESHSSKSKREYQIQLLITFTWFSTWTPKYKMMICVICNCYLDHTTLHSTQQPKFCPRSWKCQMPMIGPRNLSPKVSHPSIPS